MVVQYNETAEENCMPITKMITGITYVICMVIMRAKSGPIEEAGTDAVLGTASFI